MNFLIVVSVVTFNLATALAGEGDFSWIKAQPAYSARAYEIELEMAAQTDLTPEYIAKSRQECPTANRLIDKIFFRLTTEPHLLRLAEQKPGMTIFVDCKISEIETGAGAGGQIIISGELVDFVKAESELAFIVAHEMAHVALAHSELWIQKNIVDPTSISQGLDPESEADIYGLTILIQGGYDPLAAIRVVERTDNGETTPGDRLHGRERVRLITDELIARGWIPKESFRSPSED